MHVKLTPIAPMPIQLIGELTGILLPAGDVVLSDIADQHIYEKHYQDYKLIMDNLIEVITNPDYIGSQINKNNSISLFKEIKLNKHVIHIVISCKIKKGKYNIKSAYIMKHNQISKRITLGQITKKSPANGA